MDSITQAALGAAIGEAVAGKRIGGKALLLGAVAGTLPDLDVLATPLLSDVARFTAHRGLTHSILIMPVAAWLLAQVLSRTFPHGGLDRRRWLLLFLWCFGTHIALDLCTAYGTQIFYPLSDHPFSLSSLFIIDPFYTVPLIIGIAWLLLFKPEPRLRRRINATVLALTTAYVAAGFALKVHADRVFAEVLAADGVHYRRLETLNTPLNIFLRRAMVMTGDGYLTGWYSALNPAAPPVFKHTEAHPQRDALDALARDNPEHAQLIRFSKDCYRYEERDDGVYLVNLRIGTTGVYPFRFRVAHNDGGLFRATMPVRRAPRIAKRALGKMFDELRARIIGKPFER